MGRIAEGLVFPKSIWGRFKLMAELNADMLGFFGRIIQRYGKVTTLTTPLFNYYVIADPDFAHEVLVTQADKFHKDQLYKDEQVGLARVMGNGLLVSDGEFWKRQRKLVAPALHTKRIEAYAETMVDYTDRMLAHWRDGQRLAVDHEMMTLTLKIVAKSLFNTDVSAAADRVGAATDVIQEAMKPNDVLPAWIPTRSRLRLRRALADLDEVVYGMIADWRKTGEDRGDLLSMLLLAEDDEGQHMTDKQVRDEAVTLLLAGHETTANTLNWTFKLLAENPEVEAKLHAELDTVLAGRLPTLADLRRLPYTDMVVKESMRLMPPAYSFGREAQADVEIGEYSIPKGTQVVIFNYFMQRDPELWEQAERFMPERFSADNEKNLPRYAYLPFGGGPRICVGNSFAAMEARLLLATIAQRYQLRLTPGQRVEAEPLITLRPKGHLMMRVEQREPVPVMQPELA
ncbi:MAG: cytochrome P450 [Chloroflexi bacterium]|uniref:cytochrome P450 n=1 Tax=Candidatus Flexifilum breve TaxID=3140694 RepID=UPI003134BD94|nr:cytochrome P450 [Chloroflexota bacterium]